ncbi:MAG: ABC transporter permease [Lachnospiraceae bacterium]|nr:ABC transporter permease [Lachnospiraceae bacterium]MCR4778495.1 ABC transporter permease [Lachnospiraceae bacterium]
MIKRFFTQGYLYHKGRAAAFRAEEFVLMQIGYPLITLIFYCLIASFSFKTSDLSDWVIGNAFLLCTNACVFGIGRVFTMERYTGRLRSIIASPCSKTGLILSSGIFPALFAICSSVFGFAVGAFIFGVDFSNVNLFLAALAILVSMITATCFGLFISSFGLMTDSMHLVLNVVSYILMIFTGAEFPVARLPYPGRVISVLMPLTKGIEAMKELFSGNNERFAVLLAAEFLTGVIYALLVMVVFKFAEKVAVKKGLFDMF